MSAVAPIEIINNSDDAFPGLEDLQEHLEPRRLDDKQPGKNLPCGVPLIAVKPPPGLKLEDSPFDDLDHFGPTWLGSQTLQAPDDASKAPCAAQTLVEDSLLARFLDKAIDSLRETATPNKLPEAPSSLSAFAPPPGLHTALRSSAKPFINSSSPQPWLPHSVPWAAPRPVFNLGIGLPVQAPISPAATGGALAHLAEVHAKRPGCVLMIRKIQRLGHDSAEKLRCYFEWYGAVEGVLAAPVHGRGQGPRGIVTKLKPAFIGYVIMSTAKGAEVALAEGTSHTVDGVKIEVLKFDPSQVCLAPDDGVH